MKEMCVYFKDQTIAFTYYMVIELCKHATFGYLFVCLTITNEQWVYDVRVKLTKRTNNSKFVPEIHNITDTHFTEKQKAHSLVPLDNEHVSSLETHGLWWA